MNEQEARKLLADKMRDQGLGGVWSLDRRALDIFDRASAAAIAAILHVANSTPNR